MNARRACSKGGSIGHGFNAQIASTSEVCSAISPYTARESRVSRGDITAGCSDNGVRSRSATTICNAREAWNAA